MLQEIQRRKIIVRNMNLCNYSWKEHEQSVKKYHYLLFYTQSGLPVLKKKNQTMSVCSWSGLVIKIPTLHESIGHITLSNRCYNFEERKYLLFTMKIKTAGAKLQGWGKNMRTFFFNMKNSSGLCMPFVEVICVLPSVLRHWKIQNVGKVPQKSPA